jgi:hypothetical protein
VNYQELQNVLRDRLSSFSRKVGAACAQGLTDLPKLSENVAAALLRELMGFRTLRNLNSEQTKNFPGLDLADDKLKLGVQVTATASLDKVRNTLETAARHHLHDRYSRIVIFVLTEKQNSYSAASLKTVIPDGFEFDPRRDILDYRDLLSQAVTASPLSVRRAIDALDAYEKGALLAWGEADFDPPDVYEEVELNLIEVYPPKRLYVAALVKDASGRRPKNPRSAARALAENLGRKLPSGYEVHERNLVTFHNLEARPNAFTDIYDSGTVTPLAPSEYVRIDSNHERIVKSLLRLTLQEQLYRHKVRWQHEEGLFYFLPEDDGGLIRRICWKDKKSATRTVVIYSASKKDPTKGGFKHLAFAVDFIEISGRWFMTIRPDWYFSTNPDYRVSPISAKLLKYIKGQEVNQDVEQHFRFLCSWIRMLEADDLLSFQHTSQVRLSFGEEVSFNTHRYLDDKRWLPRHKHQEQSEEVTALQGLFDSNETTAP